MIYDVILYINYKVLLAYYKMIQMEVAVVGQPPNELRIEVNDQSTPLQTWLESGLEVGVK